MRRFFEELKRRNVLRVGAAFIVASWLVIQVVETVFPAFGFGDDAVRYVVISLAISFLPVLIFAWIFELTPEGLKFDRDIDRSETYVRKSGGRLDRAIIVVLALSTTYFAIDKFLLDSGDSTDLAAVTKTSIAVMPFNDLSEDGDQEYFSDGISEELINLLSHVPDLRVISRSSAFSFKGQNQDISTIAQQLDVDHVLEGSVRKAGSRVRITVQLINVKSDTNLFSQSHDRTLDDIFEIQDEIATEVVAHLRLFLVDYQPQSSPVDAQAYDDYLRGRYLAELGDASSMEDAQVHFESAVRIAPDFADAWVALGDIYRYRAGRGQMNRHAGLRNARGAAAKALDLDPEHPGAYVLRGRIQRNFDWDWQSADADLQKAARLDPGNPDALRGAAGLAQTLGRLDEAVRLAQDAAIVDPVSLIGLQNLAILQLFAGRLREAEATTRRLIERDAKQPTAYAMLSWIHVLSGDTEAGVNAAKKESEEPVRLFSEAIAYFAAGDHAAAEVSLNELIRNHGHIWYYQIAVVYAFTQRPDKAFAWLDKAYMARDTGMSMMLTDPFLENLHSDPRWREVLSAMNLPTP